MIVIATHNGEANLLRLLNSIEQHGTDGPDRIGVVVSGSSSNDYKEFIKELAKKRNFKWCVDETDGYESGAWIKAYHTFDREYGYLFLQDSVEILSPGWKAQFTQRAGELDRVCVPWVTFEPYLLGVTAEVGQRIINTFGLFSEPGFGIFGSMFYTNRWSMTLLENTGYFNYVPKDKVDSEAAERWWALFFNRLKIPIIPVHTNAYQHIHQTGAGLPYMRKHFHSRNGGIR